MLTREEFEEGVNQIIREFNIKKPKVEKRGIEDAELTDYFLANIESKEESIFLFASLEGQDKENLPVIKCSLIYQNEFGLTQLNTTSFFSYFPGLKFFSRWISSSAHEFNNKKEKEKVNFIFGDRPIKIFSNIGLSASVFFEIILNGYLSFKPKKILIYKIRHIGHLQNRNFTWAIFLDLRAGLGDFSFWVIFPNCCGLDSGGALTDYNSIVSLINNISPKIKKKILEFDIPYEEIQKKLEDSFDSGSYQDERFDFFDRDPLKTMKIAEALYQHLKNLRGTSNKELGEILEYYYPSIEKIYQSYRNREYSSLFRDARALLQSIGEKICSLKKIEFNKKESLRDLEKILETKNIIDSRVGSYFLSFHISASKSAHELFPEPNDLDTFEKRANIRLTAILAIYLISELIIILRKHFGIETIEQIDNDTLSEL